MKSTSATLSTKTECTHHWVEDGKRSTPQTIQWVCCKCGKERAQERPSPFFPPSRFSNSKPTISCSRCKLTIPRKGCRRIDNQYFCHQCAKEILG